MNYHVGRAGQQLGVYSEEIIRDMMARGELRPDDLAWTEGMANWSPLREIFPAAGMPSAPPLPGLPPSPLHPRSASGPPPVKPNNNLVGSILVTIFCCQILGIVSIVFAAQVDSKYAVGDYFGAQDSARKSRLWMWWAIGLGAMFLAPYLVFVLFGMLASAAGH